MSRTRRHFHTELNQLEQDVLAMGEEARELLKRAGRALDSGDVLLAEAIIQNDDVLDEQYIQIDRQALDLIALQTPVAGDLRLIAAILHINVHLERIGDASVNIARAIKATSALPTRRSIIDSLTQMTTVVTEMVDAAMQAFARRDLKLALTLPELDDPVDEINMGMYREVASCSDEPELLDWALRMLAVSRQLERSGDHAVDIAEQVAFLLTGEFREFTDASHPVTLPNGRVV